MKQVGLSCCIGILLLMSSCNSLHRSFQKIAADLTLVEQSNITSYSPADSLNWAITEVQHLQAAASNLLPEEDPRRLETPYSQILNRLRSFEAYLLAFRQNASLYNLGGEIQVQLSRTDQSLVEKLQACQTILRQAPEYYQQAREKLQLTDTTQLQLAIRKQVLGLQLLDTAYPDSLQKAGPLTFLQKQEIQTCRFALKDYIAWCNSQIIEQSQ